MSGSGILPRRRPVRVPADVAADLERDDCLAAIARRRKAIAALKASSRIDPCSADHFMRLDDVLVEEITGGLHRRDVA